MTALILVLAAVFVAWLAYQVGERIGERRRQVEIDRLRRRFTDTRPEPLHRIEP
jgi:membrane protein DedA with SNARE-associated domain